MKNQKNHTHEQKYFHHINTLVKLVDYYIDYGDDDFLNRGNMELYNTMLQSEINAEFRVRDGAHTWDYWRTALPDVLEFENARFHR